MPPDPAPAPSPGLLAALRRVVGDGQVLDEASQLLAYECDAYTIERRPPHAVVLPGSAAEVAAVMRLCAGEGVPVIPRGAGTSLSGAVLPAAGGVVVAPTRMTRVLEIDARNRRALVEAGCVNAWITNAVRGHGLYYAPDPSSQGACTIGGNIGTNSGGPHTLKHGVTTNHVLGFELVLPDGSVAWLGTEPGGGEEPGGLDLRGAAIGAEGMFGVVTRALVRLVPSPPAFRTMLAVFETVDDASRAVGAIIRAGVVPGAVEMMDQLITRAVEQAYRFGFPLDAGAVLIVELDGHAAGLGRQAGRVMELCRENGAREVRLAADDRERQELWKCRKRAFGAIGRLSPGYLTQDGVVPRSRLPEIMRFIAGVSAESGLRIPNVFHAGDGNLHPLVLFDERDPSQVRRALEASDRILGKCLELGGSVSGEHGIGAEKIGFMERQFSAADLEAMDRLRRAFDPGRRCNPHKVLPTGKRCGDFTPRRRAAA